MEISPEAMEGVKLLGDSSSVPDAIFGSVTENAFKFAAGRNCEKNTEGNLYILSDFMAKDPKRKENIFLNLSYKDRFLNCKRFPVVPGIDAGFMKQCTYGILTAIYEGAKSAGDVSMIRIGTSYPHIIDIDWRLDYFIKSNQMEKINEPQYLLSLKTQDNDVTSVDVVNISCSVDELQDLVGKLKDAAKVLEKATQG
eukprot:gene14912-6050_t